LRGPDAVELLSEAAAGAYAGLAKLNPPEEE
jgi:hypothetical protein